ncbi:Uncharacterized protein Adt_31139 [Abeliophyllum distichum]|uniref:Uncharacterized protein n=1 Tax=Abeliophyllum distichum TaxID=126358 RepID=A0ABD1RF09_9LAMI
MMYCDSSCSVSLKLLTSVGSHLWNQIKDWRKTLVELRCYVSTSGVDASGMVLYLECSSHCLVCPFANSPVLCNRLYTAKYMNMPRFVLACIKHNCPWWVLRLVPTAAFWTISAACTACAGATHASVICAAPAPGAAPGADTDQPQAQSQFQPHSHPQTQQQHHPQSQAKWQTQPQSQPLTQTQPQVQVPPLWHQIIK